MPTSGEGCTISQYGKEVTGEGGPQGKEAQEEAGESGEGKGAGGAGELEIQESQ